MTPKRISDLWPVTTFLFNKLGIRYDPTSRNYSIRTRYDGIDIVFKLGRPEDWLTALKYLEIDAAITGKDLIVDRLSGRYYVKPKREAEERFSDDVIEQIIPIYRNFLYNQPYRFQKAVAFEDLEFDTLKLNEGKGKVILSGRLTDSMWSPIEVRCWKEYRNLSELWLDENYYGSDNVGYRLIPLTGSTEAFSPPAIEFTRGQAETAKKNGINGPFTDIMDTQAMIVCKRVNDGYVTELIEELYKELIEKGG